MIFELLVVYQLKHFLADFPFSFLTDFFLVTSFFLTDLSLTTFYLVCLVGLVGLDLTDFLALPPLYKLSNSFNIYYKLLDPPF